MADLTSLFLSHLAEAGEVEADTRAAWELRLRHIEEAVKVAEAALKAISASEDAASDALALHPAPCRCPGCLELLRLGGAPEVYDVPAMIRQLAGFGMSDTAERL